jgi:hypothetical protein
MGSERALSGSAVTGAKRSTVRAPRQLQSITWEAVRSLFSPAEKRHEAFRNEDNGVWDQYRQGLIERDEAQRRILRNPDGSSKIRPPRWKTGDATVEDEDTGD